ncbi:hypothetical protein ISREJYDI_CDS0142 [Pseudomonas phage UNO-G1W1]|uniref:Uncharacterized protein n=1 Tax=Pseudomonas phage UNO-G1W1 TaxID=3136609 RepID=A0AAX4MWD3_9CAUD
MACDIIVAVAMRTESGDDYLFLYDDIFGIADFVERVEDDMGEELAYVYHIDVKTDCCVDEGYERALRDRIEELQEDDYP